MNFVWCCFLKSCSVSGLHRVFFGLFYCKEDLDLHVTTRRGAISENHQLIL